MASAYGFHAEQGGASMEARLDPAITAPFIDECSLLLYDYVPFPAGNSGILNLSGSYTASPLHGLEDDKF